MKSIVTNDAPAPIGPYSQALVVNNMVYLSGQIAIIPETGELDMADIPSETKRVMENIKGLLYTSGSDFSKVIKCSIFLSDMANFSAVNEVYASYFKAPYPARECVEVACLPKNVNVEISVIASL